MSKVYSFRLNEDNPREAQARRVIEAWMNEGYSLRHVIVASLLDYQKEDQVSKSYDTLHDQIQTIIDDTIKVEDNYHSQQSLSNAFKAGIVKSMKTGVQA